MKIDFKLILSIVILVVILSLGFYFSYWDKRNIKREGVRGWGILNRIIETKRSNIGEIIFYANGERFIERNNLPNDLNRDFYVGDTVEILFYRKDPSNFEIIGLKSNSEK